MNEQLAKQRKQYSHEIKNLQLQNTDKLMDLKKTHSEQLQKIHEEYQQKV